VRANVGGHDVRVTAEVRDHQEMNRYELTVDDRMIGVAEYRRMGDVVSLPHTVIVASERGQGWGEYLVREALDDLRRQGQRIVAQCWFVAEFVDDHPEYSDLLA
jgi:predicted GNAT family acetyltransferase